MRLRTKFQDEDFELGEVVDASIMYGYDDKIEVCSTKKMKYRKYNSIKAFTDHWEDAPEEPKKHYEILGIGVVIERSNEEDDIFRCTKQREIGNYFSSREEAEAVIEKLKAWEILKNNGFRFIDWELDLKTVADGKIWFDVGVNTQWDAEQLLEQKPEVKEALDLLFGGEE